MKKLLSTTVVLVLIGSMLSCSAIDTRKEKGTATGAVTGAVIGAIIGQAIGEDTESTLWGAAIGSVVGGIAGHEIAAYMDRQEQELRAAAARSEAMSVARNESVLTATFKSDVMFDFDSAELKPGAYAEIDRVARVLNGYPQTVIRVEGHTDSTGPEDYNQRLSERRANAVKNALIQRNVHPGRIVALGFGETMPVSSADALNRRVNVVIIPVEDRG
jgi:outer membrane protein OmpA-like peptidoglycan-associated protein